MRKLITTVTVMLSLFLSLGIQAEEMVVLDSLHQLEWNTSSTSWDVDSKIFYDYENGLVSKSTEVSDDEKTILIYDVEGNVLEDITMELVDSVWVNTERNLYQYDGALVTVTIEQKYDSAWVNVEQNLKTYDANANLTSWYDEVWNEASSEWEVEEGEVKTTKEFDTNGQEIAQLKEEYISGAWVDSKIYTYTLNAAGFVIEVQAKELEDGKWINASANSIYTYDEAGNVVTTVWNKAASDSVIGDYSVKYRKWDYVYDEKGQVVLETQYRNTTDAGDYKTYYQYTYAFDSVGNQILKVKDKYNSDYTAFDLYRKYISEYDTFNNEVYDLELRLNDDKDGYDVYRLYTKVYDENNVQVKYRRDDFESGEWNASREYDYTLDSVSGLVLEIQARDWADSLWVNTSANAIYEYDTMGNVVKELWNKSTDTSALGEYEALYYKWDRTYDIAGNMLSEERFKGNATNDGYDIYRYNEYEYDLLGNETYELQNRVSGGEYYGYNQYFYTYDANSNRTQKVWNNKKTDKSGFKTYRKYDYEYNMNNQETLMLYTRANADDSLTYDNYERTLTTYSPEGYLMVERDEEWNDSVWVLDEEVSFEISLNSNGLLSTSLEKETSDDAAYDTIEMVHYYYSDTLLNYTVVSEWVDGAWEAVETSYYTYEEGVLVEFAVVEMEDEITTSVYDAMGNELSTMVESYTDGEYVKSTLRLNTYDANANKTSYYDKVWDMTLGWVIEDQEQKREYVFNNLSVKNDETYYLWTEAYSVLNNETIGEYEEGTEGDVDWMSYTFSETSDGEAYEFTEKSVSFYSEVEVSALDDVLTRSFGKLYPNPASDRMYLPQGDYRFAIYNIAGQNVISGARANFETVSVSELSKGIYLIKYSGSDVNTTDRFIVR